MRNLTSMTALLLLSLSLASPAFADNNNTNNSNNPPTTAHNGGGGGDSSGNGHPGKSGPGNS